MGIARLYKIFSLFLIGFNVSTGSYITFTASPEVIIPVLTTKLDIRCAVVSTLAADYPKAAEPISSDDGSPANFNYSRLLSIMVTKVNSQTHRSETVASVTGCNSPVVEKPFFNEVQAVGSSELSNENGELGYLRLVWDRPNYKNAGNFSCEVLFLKSDKHSGTAKAYLTVESKEPSISDLATYISSNEKHISKLNNELEALNTQLNNQSLAYASYSLSKDLQMEDLIKNITQSCTIEEMNSKKIIKLMSSFYFVAHEQFCEPHKPGPEKYVPVEMSIDYEKTLFLCDMQTDGGGWIIFQRRKHGNINFYRKWEDYKHGFGSINSEYWLGNEKLHQLTSKTHYKLRIDFIINDIQVYVQYNTFRVGNEDANYKLTVGGYQGNGGDYFSQHSGYSFATKDHNSGSNCPDSYGAGWWYTRCTSSFLNGLYDETSEKGIRWGSDIATFVEMKIRKK